MCNFLQLSHNLDTRIIATDFPIKRVSLPVLSFFSKAISAPLHVNFTELSMVPCYAISPLFIKTGQTSVFILLILMTSHIRSAEQYCIFWYRYRRLDKDKSQSATPTRQHAEKPLIEYQSGESESKSESWTSKSESPTSESESPKNGTRVGLESESRVRVLQLWFIAVCNFDTQVDTFVLQNHQVHTTLICLGKQV